MKSKDEILKILREVQKGILEKYKIERIGLFGSVMRGETKEQSDVDVLVKFKKGADLFDFMGLALFLEDKLERKVDIVSEAALRKELKKGILKETAYL